MKAHSMRRSVWFLNFALIAAILGIGSWWLLDVREAVASVPKPQGRKAPPAFVERVKAFNGELENARTDVLSAPIKLAVLHEVILRKDYEEKDPTHFIFTGPPPPIATQQPVTEVEAAPEPTGLDALGKIAWMIYPTMVAFEFNSKKVGYFTIGEFVKQDKKQPDRFKLVTATAPEPGLYHVGYEVYDAGNEEPVATSTITWDNRKELPGKGQSVIYLIPKTLAAEGDGAETDGETDAEGAPVVPGEGTDPRPPLEPTVIDPSRLDEELTYDDLEPVVKEVNTRLVEVEFDENTRRFFTQRDARKLVETVKTQVAKDSLGNTIGLRIVDPGDAPADKLAIRRGDIIVSINGQPVKERADVVRIAESLPETVSRVTIVVDRNGRKITFNVDPRDPKTRRAAAAAAGRMGN